MMFFSDGTRKPTTFEHSILIVDDSAINQKILKKLICAHLNNFKLVQALSGQSAIDEVKKQITSTDKNFSLIIMDSQMPGDVQGQDAVSEIRAYEKRLLTSSKCAYIASCSTSINSFEERFVGSDDFLPKEPINEADVKNILQKFLAFWAAQTCIKNQSKK